MVIPESYLMHFSDDDYLAHYGVVGMKWGVRRYQNPDGTLTAEGRHHYATEHYKNVAKQANGKISNKSAKQRAEVMWENASKKDRTSAAVEAFNKEHKDYASKGAAKRELMKPTAVEAGTYGAVGLGLEIALRNMSAGSTFLPVAKIYQGTAALYLGKTICDSLTAAAYTKEGTKRLDSNGKPIKNKG